jgi:hypothetical protein
MSVVLVVRFVLLLAVHLVPTTLLHASNDGGSKGTYSFSGWRGPTLDVYYAMSPVDTKETPILIAMPGAKRQAIEVRDAWQPLACANGFHVLVVHASVESFPSEYEYNIGGVINAMGEWQPQDTWLFSAIDPIFEDFKNRSGSVQQNYWFYGHSAGGCFAHLFPLFKPSCHASKIVAANPAFFMSPNPQIPFPFGSQGTRLNQADLEKWFERRLVVMLGDQDLAGRENPLSTSPQANLQGPHVFSRGLSFFHDCLNASHDWDAPMRWKLDIISGVGHSNTLMAPHAIKHFLSGGAESKAD